MKQTTLLHFKRDRVEEKGETIPAKNGARANPGDEPEEVRFVPLFVSVFRALYDSAFNRST